MISLIGYRGTGKTSVGRELAKRLGWLFVDTDAEVERLAGRTILSIFETDGEETFRELEAEAVASSVGVDRVLSLGGGSVLRQANREAISPAYTVLLTAKAESIHRRLTLDPNVRPSLTGGGSLDEIRDMLSSRNETYLSCADLIVDTEGRTVGEVVDRICKHLCA